LLKLDLTAKGKKMAIFFENFSLKAVLVFTAVKSLDLNFKKSKTP
jgi:hypothetical protein